MNYSKKIAKSLLDIKAVGFNTKNPIRFKTGILSPVYIDNRIFPANTKQWKTVINGFKKLIEEKNLKFDVIAGIESAGIPHSATLGFHLNKPSMFIRKEIKGHGTKKSIEGGNVKNKKVLLIEDHITTGYSSLRGVSAIKKEQGKITDCLAITSYEFKVSNKNFKKEKVRLHTLTTFEHILEESLKRKILTKKQVEIINEWFDDPQAWTKKHE
jgi:orotate phosphoribosyltransferase